MNSQQILVVDKNGKHTGEYVDKTVAHTGKGVRHLAITVLLKNDKGEVLLQHRKHKIHSDIWDLTGSTHHLHKNDGSDESTEEAVYRCLRREYGIVKKVPLRILGGIDYFAKDGKNCENEHDIIVLGQYSGRLRLNNGVAHDHKWIDEKLFLNDITKNSKKYAPWAVLAVEKLKEASSFKNELDKFLKEFEPYSAQYFKNKKSLIKKYPALIKRFYEDISDISSGGKRMRGFLVYLGYLVGGGRDLKKILPICLAIELIHSFLLIHDDIIDKSDVRRNKSTMHKRYEKLFGEHYGISQAIIVGDIAGFEALDLVIKSDFSFQDKVKCIEILNKVILETAYGEALDVDIAYRKGNVKDVLQVADLKTARYSFVGPLTLGAMLGGSTSSQLKALMNYGLKIGLSFQLVDDLLGVFGDELILGKSTLSDMREGKNTLLIFKTRSLASKNDLKVINRLWGNKKASKGDLEKVKKIMKSSGSYDWSIRQMEKLKNDALGFVSSITREQFLRDTFVEMSNFIVTRRS